MFVTHLRRHLCPPVLPVLVAFALSACGSGLFGGGPDRELESLIKGGLPALDSLPQDRDSSIAYDETLEGRETETRSSGAIDDGSSLDLPAAAGALCWGIWGWDAQDRDLSSIIYDLDLLPGAQAYIAVADFAARRWEVEGPYSGDTQYPLDDLRHRSSGGMVYCAVITWDANVASVRTVTLRVETGTSFNEAESNNSFSEANHLPDLPFTGWKGHAGPPGSGGDPYDYFSFISADGDTVTVTLEWNNSLATLHLALYDSDQFFLVNDDEGNPGTRTIQHGLTAGLHWVRVRAFEGACDYSLAIDVSSPGYEEQEPNDSAGTAQQIVAPLADFLGGVGEFSYDGDDYDYYAFTAAEGDIVTVSLSYDNASANVYLRLLDAASSTLAMDEGANTGQRSLSWGLQTGIHYIRVHTVSGGCDYTMDLSLAQPGYDEIEDNDTLSEANAVSVPLQNWLGNAGDPGYDGDNFDCLSFTAQEGDVVTASLAYDNASANHYLQLFGPDKVSIKLDNGANTGTRTVVWGLHAGTHYLRVQAASGAADYTLDVTLNNPGYGELEDNDSYNEASQLTPPVNELLGSVGSGGYDGDPEDYFFFTAAEGQLVALSLTYDKVAGNVALSLYDEAHTSLYQDDELNPGVRGFNWGLKAGNYFVRVKALSGSSDYLLNVVLGTPGYDELEDNDTTGQAQLLSGTQTDFFGSVGFSSYDGDDYDYYFWVVNVPTTISFHLDYISTASDNVWLYILDNTSSILDSDTAGNPGYRDVSYSFTPGTYFLRVRAGSGGSDYWIDVT